MDTVPTPSRSPWLRLLWFAVALGVFFGTYSLGTRYSRSKPPPSPSSALLIRPPIALADFRFSDEGGAAVTRESLVDHWTLMALAPREDAVRPWLQQLAAIFNHLATEPALQKQLLLASTVPGPAREGTQDEEPIASPWRLLRGSPEAIARLREQLGLEAAAVSEPGGAEAADLLLVIDPQSRLYATYRFDQAGDTVARDLVALVHQYSIETEGASPRGH